MKLIWGYIELLFALWHYMRFISLSLEKTSCGCFAYCWTGLMGDNTNKANLTNWWRLDSRHANVTYENMSEVSFSLDQLALNSWHVGNKMTDRRSPLWHKATHNPNNVDKKQHLRRQWQSSRRGQPLAWRSQSICHLQAYRRLDGKVSSRSRSNCSRLNFDTTPNLNKCIFINTNKS